jgi:hypothetical protein
MLQRILSHDRQIWTSHRASMVSVAVVLCWSDKCSGRRTSTTPLPLPSIHSLARCTINTEVLKQRTEVKHPGRNARQVEHLPVLSTGVMSHSTLVNSSRRTPTPPLSLPSIHSRTYCAVYH